MSQIRAKVVCVLWHAGRMLLIRATDPHDGSSFLLPPGGGLEFGELLEDAVKREMQEELGIDLAEVNPQGVSENIFQFAGREEHELVFVYDADCPDPGLARRQEVEVVESDGAILPARWYTPSEVVATGLPVFPDGLFQLLNLSRPD